ncbi:DUF4932 domain-containing protein [Tissierella pigra]|uniref:DUF4932 domain-containing protein n=1 Tax=Tissierella pigra TaxID=2607614 RepID=A0A6N7XUW4_9FIRM|nr:DUF4932 domain-containing protein [Tissierella pigra]MSU01567.1 DUF4932 domain-containing protein [Tissierella pigra]
MNRKSLILFVVICIVISNIMTACGSIKTSTDNSVILMEPIVKTKNSLNISVDPRIELLSIVQYLSNYNTIASGLITKESFEYKDKVRKHFMEFRKHEAIKFFNEISKNGFTFDAPPTSMLFMDNNFKVRKDVELTDYIARRAGSRENIIKLYNLLEDFASISDFTSFFNDNIEYYNTIIDNTLFLIDDEFDIINHLEGYYGWQNKSYNIVLSSLYGAGAYGPSISNKNQDVEIYSIIGCQMLNGNLDPSFGTIDYFNYLQQHEFSHSFINPTTSKNLDLANSYEELFEPIKDEMKYLAYAEWETCLNEHIIRALTSRFASHENKTKGRNLLKAEEEKNFIYVEALYNKLEEYEDNRDKYPTIEDFYPELLKALDQFKN